MTDPAPTTAESSTPKHTPAPWTVEMIGQDGLYGHAYISGHITSPLHTYCGNTKGRTDSIAAPDSMTWADAHLIAAAPELRDALEGLANITHAMTSWLEDAQGDICDAGNPDGGSPQTCNHCIVNSMVESANATLKIADRVLMAAEALP